LIKCEQLEKLAIETTLIWKDDFVRDLSEFVKQYVRLLKALYKQQIIIKNTQKMNFSCPMNLGEKKKKLNDYAEKNQLFDTIKNIDDCFKKIKNADIEQKLVENLMLK